MKELLKFIDEKMKRNIYTQEQEESAFPLTSYKVYII
jgi:hypothetical protein